MFLLKIVPHHHDIFPSAMCLLMYRCEYTGNKPVNKSACRGKDRQQHQCSPSLSYWQIELCFSICKHACLCHEISSACLLIFDFSLSGVRGHVASYGWLSNDSSSRNNYNKSSYTLLTSVHKFMYWILRDMLPI